MQPFGTFIGPVRLDELPFADGNDQKKPEEWNESEEAAGGEDVDGNRKAPVESHVVHVVHLSAMQCRVARSYATQAASDPRVLTDNFDGIVERRLAHDD